MPNIRFAAQEDYPKIRDFYYALTDEMDAIEFKPGWKRDIYPTQAFLKSSIANKELFLCEMDGQIASCMIVNHTYNTGYQKISWSVAAEDSELLVIHALGVRLRYSGKGLAKRMVQEVMEIAQANRIKTIRLDVLEGNLPAERTYTAMGFRYLDTLQMYYEDTGWTNYKMFEWIPPERS